MLLQGLAAWSELRWTGFIRQADASLPWAGKPAGHDGRSSVLCKSWAAGSYIIHQPHHGEALRPLLSLHLLAFYFLSLSPPTLNFLIHEHPLATTEEAASLCLTAVFGISIIPGLYNICPWFHTLCFLLSATLSSFCPPSDTRIYRINFTMDFFPPSSRAL